MPTSTPTPKVTRSAAAKAAAKLHAEERRTIKIHTIAERRAKSHGLSRKDFIAQIVKGKYPPITAEDIDAEPNPEPVATVAV